MHVNVIQQLTKNALIDMFFSFHVFAYVNANTGAQTQKYIVLL